MGYQDNTPPYEHQIICTGKETHRRVDFRPIFSKGHDAETDAELFGELPSDDKAPELYGCWREYPSLSELKPTYQFKCKYCGRDTQISAAKLVKVLDVINDAGRWALDISRLPF